MANKIIQGLFEEYASDFPHHIAAQCGTERLTYSDLNHRANQLAQYLLNRGIKPDTPVALCLERSFDFLITLMAILKAGGGYLPLDASQPQERLLFLLHNSQCPILITHSVYQDQFASFQGNVIILDKERTSINNYAAENPISNNTPENLAYIIYTSGSTGTPKGVLIEHHSVVNYCLWFADYSQCKPQQRIDFSANPIFDMSVTTSIVPLMLGLTVVICEDNTKKEISSYLQYLAKSRINIMKLTPSFFKVLLHGAKNEPMPLPHLNTIILGGENLSASECQSWLDLYPNHILFNEYGPTEATVAVSAYGVNRLNCHLLEGNVPIGIAGTNMGFTILDANHQPVADGDEGELFISGKCLARGYLNQVQFSQEHFLFINDTRFYKTGDLCKKRTDGMIEYLGRMDDQVKIRGFRIEPNEILKHLWTHPDIKEVTLLAQKDTFGEQKLIVYYIPKKDSIVINTTQLRRYLQKDLPEYMIPTGFVRMESFPLTANGKLDKSAFPVPLLATNHNYVEPVTVLEKKLTQIWYEELGVQLIGLYDDFFDLGGHSLSAARIISKINAELSRNIRISDFYKASNIATLASKIKKTKNKNMRKRNKHFDYYKTRNIPLSDFQFLLWMTNTFEPRARKLNIVDRKRLQGYLNEKALEFAFQAVLKKHRALTFQILKLQPAQKIQKNWSFNLDVVDLTTLSSNQSDMELQQSMAHLINFYPWPKKTPLVIAKLFFLPDNESELQICMPHFISDDHCTDILFSELSQFYLKYNELSINEIKTDSHFKEHIFNERTAMKMHLEEDIQFWEKYLQDANLFTFPEEHIIPNMQAEGVPYSTYSILPEESLLRLKLFCERNHISMNNALCAIIALALRNCCGHCYQGNPSTFLNRIQSTRDNSNYDNTIGCFLRIEPTKIVLDAKTSLIHLSQQIRNAMIDTSSYQYCPNLVKLCSINSLKPTKIKKALAYFLTPLYMKLLKIPSLYRKILQHCGSRMISFKRNNEFLININIRSNFIDSSNKSLEFCGLSTKSIDGNKYDLLSIDYIFEASFIRDANTNIRHLVISANLKPVFREKITQEVIQIMNTLELDNHSVESPKTKSEQAESLQFIN